MGDRRPFVAAARHVLGVRGVPGCPDVHPPLPRLDPDEAAALEPSLVRRRLLG
jgi:hypothetical protein